MTRQGSVETPRRTKRSTRWLSAAKAAGAVASTLAVLAASLAFTAATAVATPSPKVTICHASASTSNPYTTNSVDESSVDEEGTKYLDGHGTHLGPVFNPNGGKDQPAWGDIIPPFTNTTVPNGSVFPGYNWNAEGQAIWNAGCTSALVYTATRTVSLTRTICYLDDQTITLNATGTATATSTTSQRDADRAAQAQAQANADADMATQLAQYPGFTAGACGVPEYTATRTAALTQTICYLDDQTFTLTGDGSATETSTVSQADADARAQAAAEALAAADLAAQLADYPGYTPGECGGPGYWTDSASKGLVMEICLADTDADLTISVVGTGSATSTVSQLDATTKATNAASSDADAKMAAELARYPGYSAGVCVPTTPTEVIVPEPGTVPVEPVTAPESVTIPPEAATVPAEAATVPAAVPAGGGSSAPEQGFPSWALLLVTLGALGAAGAGLRLAMARSR